MTAGEPFRTIIEPFRIHSVEPMRLTTRAERASALEAAGYNLFELAGGIGGGSLAAGHLLAPARPGHRDVGMVRLAMGSVFTATAKSGRRPGTAGVLRGGQPRPGRDLVAAPEQ